MKKFLKLSMIISIVLIMLLSNISYATNAITDTLTNEVFDDKHKEKALTEVYTSVDENDGIMLINGDIEISSNVIDSDIFQVEDNISIESEVNGNLYLIGKTVNVSSEYINGNVFVIAEDVVIKGNITGSMYVMAKKATIETDSVSTVYVAAENITLSENANIMNDLNVVSKQLNIKGNINRALNAVIENMDVAQTAEYIAKGNVSYSGECTGKTELLDTIELVKNEKEEKVEKSKKDIALEKIQTEISKVASAAIIISILFLMIKNKEIEKVEDYGQTVGMGILKGLLFLIVIPIAAFILLCTVFGIPLSILLITVYIIMLYISMPVASLKIAEMIYSSRSSSNKLIMILYAVCVYIITRVIALASVVGGLVNFLILLYGFGTLIRWMFGTKKTNKTEDKSIVINEENKME